jgi:ketosteroid isomerase-like protein
MSSRIRHNTEMTNTAQQTYADWLERYRRAWIERDADAASQLFTEDATYREQPFQAPFVGRAAIRDYWSRVTASQTDVKLRYGRSIVDGHRVAVEWWANLQTNDGPLTLAGEFLLLFAESGQCRELREYWVLTPSRVEPPAGWGA